MRLEIDRLEIACGHDGLLQGKPEPVVMVGVYIVDPGATRLVARGLWRFGPPSTVPGVAVAQHAVDMHTGPTPRGTKGWAIFAVAVEEDSGLDVQRLFAALDRPSALQLVTEDGETAFALDDALTDAKPHAPRRVHLLVDSVQAPLFCMNDDWVGAALVGWVGAPPRRAELRLHFSSGERRNDWTAVVQVRA